jgi:DNA repair protein RadC
MTSIAQWRVDDRPREKLIAKGPEALSDAELVAILLSAERSAFDLIPGLGDAKYAQVQAVLEMSRRALRETLDRGTALSSPHTVRDYLRLRLQGKAHEVFVGVFLDAQNRVLAVEELFKGTLTQTSVFPREIVKRALHYNAAAVIFAHNHPSGVAEPSRAHTLALVDVKVLDHFVVGGDSAMSFAERGLL